MAGTEIDIESAGGTIGTYVVHPDGDGPLPQDVAARSSTTVHRADLVGEAQPVSIASPAGSTAYQSECQLRSCRRQPGHRRTARATPVRVRSASRCPPAGRCRAGAAPAQPSPHQPRPLCRWLSSTAANAARNASAVNSGPVSGRAISERSSTARTSAVDTPSHAMNRRGALRCSSTLRATAGTFWAQREGLQRRFEVWVSSPGVSTRCRLSRWASRAGWAAR